MNTTDGESTSSQSTKRKAESGQTGNSSKKSFSTFSRDLAEKVLKIGILKFANRQKILPEKVVGPLIDPPETLVENVFTSLANELENNLFPTSISNEDHCEPFVRAVFDPIVSQIKQDLKLPENDLIFGRNHSLENNSKSSFLESSRGQPDFVVQYSGCSRRTRLAIIEMKNRSFDDGFQQCMLYMQRSYELIGDQIPIFGFCSNGVELNAISYDGKIFKMLFKRTVMFPGMNKRVQKPDQDGKLVDTDQYLNKEIWKAGYSSMVGIVYSALKSQLVRVCESERAKELLR